MNVPVEGVSKKLVGELGGLGGIVAIPLPEDQMWMKLVGIVAIVITHMILQVIADLRKPKGEQT